MQRLDVSSAEDFFQKGPLLFQKEWSGGVL